MAETWISSGVAVGSSVLVGGGSGVSVSGTGVEVGSGVSVSVGGTGVSVSVGSGV
jgi:hypothetical protein